MGFKVKIFSCEKKILEDEADFVVVPGKVGEIGILPKHAPLLSTLKAGDIKIKKASEERRYEIKNGLVEIRRNEVKILVE